MDMSDQEGAGSASDPEATLTHPSARDTMQSAGVVYIASPESQLAEHDKHGNSTSGTSTNGPDQPVRDQAGPEPDQLKAITQEFYEHHPRARELINHIESGFAENPDFLRGLLNNKMHLAPMLYALIAQDQRLESAAEVTDIPSFFAMEVHAAFHNMLKRLELPYEIDTTLQFRPKPDSIPNPETPVKPTVSPTLETTRTDVLKSLTPEMRTEVESLVKQHLVAERLASPQDSRIANLSDQEGAGSASDPEATLTHPSARDN
jgi:hypothetical protein